MTPARDVSFNAVERPPVPEGDSKRLRLARRVRRLRDAGMTHRQVAEHMGISRSWAAELDRDPAGTMVAERKALLSGTCVDCGVETSYNTGGAPKRCRGCAKAHRTARNLPCGTRAAHARGCRCEACIAAYNAYMREWQRQHRRAQRR